MVVLTTCKFIITLLQAIINVDAMIHTYDVREINMISMNTDTWRNKQDSQTHFSFFSYIIKTSSQKWCLLTDDNHLTWYTDPQVG